MKGVDCLLDKDTFKAVEEVLKRAMLYKFIVDTQTEVIMGETEQGQRYADGVQQRIKFIELIEQTVNRLPILEKQLVSERYLVQTADYIHDYQVYKDIMQISNMTYSKIRAQAFKRLAEALLPVKIHNS
jgi:DNA-directed RNA polymerase specialized sigma subunit